MKYIELKSIIISMVEEHMANGLDREKAELRVLEAGLNMYDAKKIGVVDVKLMFQILGYEFSGELQRKMEGIKAVFRMRYHLDEIIQDMLSKGYTKEQATDVALRACYEAFVSGNIDSPEMLNGLLWSLGYRLKEEFFLDYYSGKQPKFDYEEDQ